jgi:hypothetical protein
MMRRTTRVLGLVLLTGLLSVPAAQAGARVFVGIGPPALIVETRPPAPYPTYVWRTGYHRWVGGQYVWAGGAWVRPPYRGAVWVPGRWDHERRGYFWRAGRWGRR